MRVAVLFLSTVAGTVRTTLVTLAEGGATTYSCVAKMENDSPLRTSVPTWFSSSSKKATLQSLGACDGAPDPSSYFVKAVFGMVAVIAMGDDTMSVHMLPDSPRFSTSNPTSAGVLLV
jgi:hypothetical protein